MHRRFHLAYSLLSLAVLLVAQDALMGAFPAFAPGLMLGASLLGAGLTLYFATEAIEEVRNASRMLLLVLAVAAEFVAFFAFQYWFSALLSPANFPSLPQDAVSYLLQSIMVFVFNPLYMPETLVGRALLLINTASALGLVVFVLQNAPQIRRLGQHPEQSSH